MARAPSPQTMLKQAANSLRHALDPVAWAAETIGFHCDKWQADFMRSNAPQSLCRVSRQAGKSQSTSIMACHVAIFEPGSLILLISPTLRQASELLLKVRTVLRHRSLNVKLAQDAATSVELANGSRVVSLPSSPDAIRGYSAPRMVVEDEAAFVTDDVHLALRPMLATSKNGRFILLSTPAGKAGHFYEAAHSPHWEKFKVTAHDIPRIDKDWLERERYEHGDLYYQREFMVEFSDSEFQFFGSDLIEAAFNCDAEPLKLSIFT